MSNSLSPPPLHIQQGSRPQTLVFSPNHRKLHEKIPPQKLHITNTAIMMNLVISLFLQLSMFMLAEAAPLTVQSAKPWQAGTGGGIVGFIVLVLDIIAWSK